MGRTKCREKIADSSSVYTRASVVQFFVVPLSRALARAFSDTLRLSHFVFHTSSLTLRLLHFVFHTLSLMLLFANEYDLLAKGPRVEFLTEAQGETEPGDR